MLYTHALAVAVQHGLIPTLRADQIKPRCQQAALLLRRRAPDGQLGDALPGKARVKIIRAGQHLPLRMRALDGQQRGFALKKAALAGTLQKVCQHLAQRLAGNLLLEQRFAAYNQLRAAAAQEAIQVVRRPQHRRQKARRTPSVDQHLMTGCACPKQRRPVLLAGRLRPKGNQRAVDVQKDGSCIGIHEIFLSFTAFTSPAAYTPIPDTPPCGI